MYFIHTMEQQILSGYVDERFLWGYGDPVGQYNVTVIADDGINKVSRQYDTTYKGYHSFYVLND